jgi:pectate lyase
MYYGNAGSDADQIKGDGALDCKGSTFCTISYNHFVDNGKSNLLGLSEDSTTGLFVTYHHNWYDHCDSRHPRVRFYSVHFYNNYLDGISKYGAGATMGSSLFIEGNYFRNCKHPMMISMQGTDVWNESTKKNDPTNMGTFSDENGGMIKAFNNTFDASTGTNNMRFVAYGDTSSKFNIAGVISSTTDFDAYVAQTRDELVPASVKSFQGGNIYNNFDTNPSLYIKNLIIDDPASAVTKDTTYAGRVKGGDIKWKFNNSVDDASYLVNTALKAALTNYKTTLVSVQGDSASATTPVDTTTAPAGDVIHNFTLSGTNSTFFTITGNLSTSKGTVSYAGLLLTQCLKIESSTNISFKTTQAATLTLVFNETFTGKISINGTSYSATAGIVTVTLLPGSNVIIKVDAANLYYMSLVNKTTNNENLLQKAGNKVIRFCPNPVTENLTIKSVTKVNKVEIYDLKGTLVKRAGADTRIIDMSNLKPGTYLVKVYTGEGIYKQSIIKN